MDEELLREMEAVLAEPEGPVKRRLRQIKKNRKEQKKTELSELCHVAISEGSDVAVAISSMPCRSF